MLFVPGVLKLCGGDYTVWGSKVLAGAGDSWHSVNCIVAIWCVKVLVPFVPGVL